MATDQALQAQLKKFDGVASFDYDAFNPTRDIPPLKGKVILITGANSGIGKKTALELAKHNPSIIYITARSTEKGQSAISDIKAIVPDANLTFIELELSSLASVQKAAKTFLSKATRLDILILNAGVWACPQALTNDGYEIQFQTNHIGSALLLKLLTPLLTKTSTSSSSDVRVLSLTSIGVKHPQAAIPFSDLKRSDGHAPIIRYVQSKMANMLYAKSYAAHHPSITTLAIHPGEVDTNLFTREPGDEQTKYLQEKIVPSRTTSLENGVKNSLWGATVAKGEVESGAYYEPVGVKGVPGEKGLRVDEAMAEELWEWTERELERWC